MKNRQIDTKLTKQVRIDSGWHKILKLHAAKLGKTIKEVLEDILTDWWSTQKGNE